METIDVKWDLLGAKLARLSDEEQGKFFTGFAFELNKFESTYMKQLQMCSINKKLSKEHKEILEESLPCIWENIE